MYHILEWLHAAQQRLETRMMSIRYGSPERWKKRYPVVDVPGNPVVHFIIPLISRAKSNDWEVVQQNLKRTIASLLRQTSGNWTVAIACQDYPSILPADDRISFVRFAQSNRSYASNDKRQKLARLLKHAAKNLQFDGYIFFLDGDDIVHPRLVDFICRDNNGHGYLVDKGYLVDLSERKAVEFGFGQNPEKPFYEGNGSVTAVRFDARCGSRFLYPALHRGDHKKSHINLQRFGLRPEVIPFPSILYVFNHGDNLEIHRGRGGFQAGTLGAALGDSEIFRRIIADFGIGS